MKEKKISLYKPNIEDLWFRSELLSDEETMSYNHAYGGTIEFLEEDWRPWYQYWLVDTENKRFYSYIKNEEGAFIGEVAYHYDEEIDSYITNVIIYAKYRGLGYGGQALDILCEKAKENGIKVLYDDIAIDNKAISLFLKHGFIEDYKTKDKIYLKKEL